MPYGYELVLDLHECDETTFNRKSLKRYFKELCDAIEMQRDQLYFWDDLNVPEELKQTSPHTKGTSAVQFILTSSIVIHTLDIPRSVYVNIFSCKAFDKDKAEKITREWFGAKKCHVNFLERL